MKHTLLGLLISVLVAGAFGCSSEDDGGDEGWGCDKIADTDACIQFTGSQWSGAERATYQAECTDDAGTIVDACPAAGLAGTCTVFAGTPAESVQHFYTGADLVSAEQQCVVGGGTWSTP